MPEGILLPDYALQPDGSSLSERQGVREVPVLEGEELETMRMACKLGREVLDIAARFMRPGVTGDEIDRVVYQACVDRKIYPSPLNYFRFPKTVCEGDIVNLDVSIYYQGFHSDLNETFFIGECDEDSQRLVSEVERANKELAQLDRQAKKPPAQWSAARTKSTFEERRAAGSEQSVVGDRAGAQGGGGGGGGPSLPFRIREVKLFPRSIGAEPVFSIAKPRMLDN
eukprot:g20868.t1